MKDKEIIIAITDTEETNGYSGMAGYKVITSSQEITLLIDNESSCCERWGWFWCNDNPKDFIGAELLDIKLTDEALNKAIMIKKEIEPSVDYYEGGICYVNLETNKGTLQFVAYNQHNGYYGHTAKIISKQLKHEKTI